MQMFTIHDSKAEIYHNPIFYRTNGEAIREFEQIAKNKETTVGKFPEDYTLVHIGSYDDAKGLATPTHPTIMAKATDYIQ